MPKLKKAVPGGSSVGSRRSRLASLEATRKAEQRRRTVGLVALCLVLAVALLAYPVYLFVEDYRARSATLEDLGTSLSAAGCDPVSEAPATGSQEHVADGTKVPYPRFPPDSGPHYDQPAPFTRQFYAVGDRPPGETLVHNLEHGYTIAWYRDTMPEEQIDELEQIAKTFAADTYNPANKFIAAPWTSADGAGFPEGKNLVLTHWYADPAAGGDPSGQKGVRQSCSGISGQAVMEFMTTYPYAESPEGEAS
jgi:hypothetical protein